MLVLPLFLPFTFWLRRTAYAIRDSLSDQTTTLRVSTSMESLKHLLTTNQAPTNDERGRLKETLADYDEKLDEITQKILVLEEHLRSLNEEQTALLEASTPIRRALSPFRQLPEDVVRAIFVACLETRRNPTMANTEAPVLLTQVSRATRMISLTTPELWAAIHIPIIVSVPLEVIDLANSVMSARAEGVSEWLLRRSGNLPLYISVSENRKWESVELFNCEMSDTLINVLISCRSRWKNVQLSCRSTIASRVSSLSPFHVPLLQSLTISTLTGLGDEVDIWRDNSILKAPMLKRFCHMDSRATYFYPLNWRNLTHLGCTHMHSDHTDVLAYVLRQATCLIRLDLSIQASDPPASDPILLPRLTTLVITIFGALDPQLFGEGIFESIYAPSLENVSYNTRFYNVVRSPALIACLKNSSRIRELSTGRPSSLHVLIEYLRHCPSLRILHVPASNYAFEEPLILKHNNNTFLNTFSQDDPAECLCLQMEYFRYETTLAVSLPVLHNFLAFRNGTIPGLTRLKAVGNEH